MLQSNNETVASPDIEAGGATNWHQFALEASSTAVANSGSGGSSSFQTTHASTSAREVVIGIADAAAHPTNSEVDPTPCCCLRVLAVSSAPRSLLLLSPEVVVLEQQWRLGGGVHGAGRGSRDDTLDVLCTQHRQPSTAESHEDTHVEWNNTSNFLLQRQVRLECPLLPIGKLLLWARSMGRLVLN